MFSDKKKENKDIFLPTISNPQEKSFKLTMLTSVNDILQEAEQQKEYVTMSQNNDVLSRFSDLNAKLMALNKTV